MVVTSFLLIDRREKVTWSRIVSQRALSTSVTLHTSQCYPSYAVNPLLLHDLCSSLSYQANRTRQPVLGLKLGCGSDWPSSRQYILWRRAGFSPRTACT